MSPSISREAPLVVGGTAVAGSALIDIGEGLVLETNDVAHWEGEGVVLETNDEAHWEGEGPVLETNDVAHWEDEGPVLETNDIAHWEGEGPVLETNGKVNLQDEKQVPSLTATEPLGQQRRSIRLLSCSTAASNHSASSSCQAPSSHIPKSSSLHPCAFASPRPRHEVRYQSPGRSHIAERVHSLLPQPACSDSSVSTYALAPTDANLQEGADGCGGRRRRAVGRCKGVAGAAHAISTWEHTSSCSRDTQHSRLLGCSSQPPWQIPKSRLPMKRSHCSPKRASHSSTHDEA